MTNVLNELVSDTLRSDVPDFRAGDTIKVHVKVVEGSRSRVQVFQGVVIRVHGSGVGRTFTVRKICSVSASSAPSRCTPRSSRPSRSSPAVTCVAPSSTTCATCAARRRRSRSAATAEPAPSRGRRRSATSGSVSASDFTRPRLHPDRQGRGGAAVVVCPGSRQGSPRAETGRKGRRQLPLWQETILLLGVALVLAIVIKALFLQAFYIPSESMEPGLVRNDRILVQKVSTGRRTPQRGDVVVFKDPGGWLPPSEAAGPTGAVRR